MLYPNTLPGCSLYYIAIRGYVTIFDPGANPIFQHIFYFFPAASLLLSCIEYRIAARKQQGTSFMD